MAGCDAMPEHIDQTVGFAIREQRFLEEQRVLARLEALSVVAMPPQNRIDDKPIAQKKEKVVVSSLLDSLPSYLKNTDMLEEIC